MKVVGYVRISTTLKRQDDQALEKQAEKIREACLGAGFDLHSIYEDIGSASSKDSLKHRHGLQDALHMAASEQAPIVVTEPSRLFRSQAEASRVCDLYPAVRFWSIQSRSFLTKKQLLVAVAAAAAEAEAVRRGASKAQISRGFKGPDQEARLKGSQQSRKQRKEKAAARIERLADILAQHEGPGRQLTHAEAAALFNAHMIKTSQMRDWTKTNVRRDLKAARQRLNERQEDELLAELNMAA